MKRTVLDPPLQSQPGMRPIMIDWDWLDFIGLDPACVGPLQPALDWYAAGYHLFVAGDYEAAARVDRIADRLARRVLLELGLPPQGEGTDQSLAA